MQTVTIKINAKNFGAAVKKAKECGGRFDPTAKTWAIPAHRPELNRPAAYGWWVVTAPGADPATNYQGQASMDAADSIF